MISIQDDWERKRALYASRSFIVQAPAGSGKTELLIQRFLKLMRYVEYPEQILAMTFTRKAAGEMKERILTALESGLMDTPPKTSHQKRTWELAQKALEQDRIQQWRLLDNPSRLKIQTIDSFCRSLTVQMPLLSGLGDPPPTEENTWEFYQETARRTLQMIEEENPEGEAARLLLSHLDNSKSSFLRGIIHLLEKRAQWLTLFFKKLTLGETSKATLQKVLANVIEHKLQIARELFPSDIAHSIPTLASFSAKNLAIEYSQHTNACLIDLKNLPPPRVAHLEQWKALAWLLTTEKNEYRKSSSVKKDIGFPPNTSDISIKMKEDFKNILQLLTNMQKGEKIRKALQEIKLLPFPFFSDTDWHSLNALLTLFPKLEETLRGVFREHGKADFTEITLSALQALGVEDNPTELLLKLDMRLQHILVDEYQDTSFKQHQLLEKLTCGWMPDDGRSLFIVGDPMQSIYRFRDAEVGLFLSAQSEGIGNIKLESLTLKTNFRSQKKIVTWVNKCFGKIFPPLDDPILNAVKYTQAQAAQSEENFSGVVLHPIDEPKTNQEANLIIKLIRDIRKTHKTASIAVLVRAKPHLQKIVLALQEKGIPFQAEEISALKTRPIIMDLLALTQSLLFLQDRLSWLSVLRAPWFGLSLSDLHQLCYDDTFSSIWTMLNDKNRTARLSTDGQARINRLIPVMRNAIGLRFTANFRDVVEGCWIALGGPACINATTLKDTEIFFEKIDEITQEGDIRRLQNFEKSLEVIYPPASAGDTSSIKIMTMHKAKGLEFDFVILPGLGKPLRREKKRLLFWVPYGQELLIAPIQEKGGESSKVYDFLASLDKEKESLETFRLLYVAATRAKKQLHLLGHAPINKNGKRKPAANSLLAKLWSYLEKDWPQSAKEIQVTSEKTQKTQQNLPTIKRLSSDFPIATNTAAKTSGYIIDPEFVWAGNQARCLGTVLHAVFHDLAGESTQNWTDMKKSRPALISALLSEGLPYNQLEGALNLGMRAIKNILQDETGRWILKKHTDHRSEFPLTGNLDGSYENRIIDRTFVDENDIRWIIDFKTGEHQGTDLEGFFTEEKERYRHQLEEYEELVLQSGERHLIKKALYYPMHKRLIEIEGK